MRLLIIVLAAVGTLHQMTATAAVPIQAPSIAVTADGRVAILNTATGLLSIAARTGTTSSWKVPFAFRPTHVVATPQGLVVLCSSKERGQPAFWLVEDSGKSTSIRVPKALQEEIVTNIAASPIDGSLYLLTARRMLHRILLTRSSELSMDQPIFLEFTPGAIAVSRGGDIAVVDTGARSLVIFQRGSRQSVRIKFVESVASSIAYTADGRSLFAATPSGAGIVKVELPTGEMSPIPSPGFAPASFAAGGDGSVWAIDPRGNRVVQLEATGRVVQTRPTMPTSIPRASSGITR